LKAVIFDIDGVIADPSKRLEKCLKELGATDIKNMFGAKRRKFWKIFLSSKYMHLDKPIAVNIEYIRKLKEQGYYIILLTGRRKDTQGQATLKQLERWGVPYDEIYFRYPMDFRKDVTYKANIIKKLKSRGYEIVEIWDDMEKIAQKLKKLVPNAKVVVYDFKEKRMSILI